MAGEDTRDSLPAWVEFAFVAAEILVDVVRSGFVEGHHRGHAVMVAADGAVELAIGDVTVPVFPRSSNKPIQALGMLRAGLDLDGELLAVAMASHSGEAFHLDAVRTILSRAGLSEADLRTPADYPLEDEARDAFIRAGHTRAPIAMNCSGKHAAMLATCVANGWDTDTYLDPDHPLQQQILATFSALTGEPVQTVAVDGCGAPLLSTSLVGLARAFRALATATDGPEAKVANAIRQHREFTSGTRRDEAALLRAIPGAIGKGGAESCYALALPDGRAVALKTDDGAARARPILMSAALDRMGVTSEPGVDADAVRATGTHVLLGGGRPVGSIRALL
jgi:L-asparaginase II